MLEPTEESREIREGLMGRIREAIAEVARRHAASHAVKTEGNDKSEPVVVREDVTAQPAMHPAEQRTLQSTSVPSATTSDHHSQVKPVPPVAPPSGWFSTSERLEAVPSYFNALKRAPQGRKPLKALSASEMNARGSGAGGPDQIALDDTVKLPALLSPSKQDERPRQLPTLASVLEKAVAEQARMNAPGAEDLS